MTFRPHYIWALLVTSVLAFGGASVDAADADVEPPASAADTNEYYELFSVLVDTIDQVERNYVKKIDRRELLEAAIQGVLAKLDPYSSYIRPDDFGDFQREVESKFGGIGIQITIEDGELTVLSPLVGTPAYRAGLRAGDRIVKIEGESTEGISTDEAVSRLKGKVGTEVNITIVHLGQDEPIEVTIRREVIAIPTVLGDRRGADDDWDFMLDDELKIGYIRVTAFSRNTADELRAAMEQLEGRDFKGLILDLRFNPGGLLSSAIAVSDMFIAEGRIVSTEGRNSKPRAWEAHRSGTFEGFPMAVIVNRYSASASEIVAACLQDHDRAIVVGERTWGKGSVQNVIELEGGRSALKLTTAGYLRPNGKNIHRFPDASPEDEWGVSPNDGYKVRLNNAELAALILSRRERDILRSQDAAPEDETAEDDANDESPEEVDESAAAEEPSESESDAENASDEDGAEYDDRQMQKAIEYVAAAIQEVADGGEDATDDDAADEADDE